MTASPVCVVAGVGPGVGFAVAKRFSKGGFFVALLARNVANVNRFASEIKGAGAAGFAVDLADPRAVTDVLSSIRAQHGDPEVLVYNAASWRAEPAMKIHPDHFNRELGLSVTGALVCAQEVYPAMKSRGRGTILFTGGGLALRPEYGAGVAALTAGKSALRGLPFALAKELAGDGIHVATVTIAGTVAAGTPFDPDRIAERYWALHSQSRENWQTEEVFAGGKE